MALHAGARFGRYELVSRLGRGGMAETYRARLVGEAGVTKPVLIKKVLPEYANDQAFTTMFISEARISATLSHGTIAQVYDFGRVDGEYFLAMEYVDGQPLDRIIKRALKSGPTCIPAPLAAFIGIEMCRGLHYAHTRKDEQGKPLGIVHRDISPDNVLVSYEGQVKIVDFGIAKARELRGFNTEPGVVKGKYLFFSPEQARGHEVDARTDVWATGIVLYEMLCGQLPVQGPQYVAVHRLIKGDFPRPRELNPALPVELEDIVMQALAVNREERTGSCHELGDALAGFLYSAEPRFSGMSLSHFAQALFREDLIAEGRQVQIPRSFQEQLSRWQGATAPSRSATPPAEPMPRAPQPPPDTVPAESALSTRKALYTGLGAGAALTVFALVLVFVAMGEPQLQAAQEPSPLKPLAQATIGTTPPSRVSIPEPAPPPPSPPENVRPEPSKEERAGAAREEASRLLAAKQYPQAVLSALLCLEFEPKNAECHKLAGDAHTELGEKSKAAERYRAFLSLAPDHPQAPAVKEALGGRLTPPSLPSDPARALGLSSRGDAPAAFANAAALLRARQYAEASQQASWCVKLTPRNADCHMILGAAQAGMGRFDTAVVHYRKFLELAPDHKMAPKVRQMLAEYDRAR
ncbi:MAG: protein kinase [Myxococcaceae bacterium]|nr:protein kinase [Myxococcaceae bacterium]